MQLEQITSVNALRRLRAINGCALSTTPTLHSSYLLAKQVIEQNVPGDLVECGVYAGSQCGAMALAVQELKNDKLIHCFDSFQGFPKASEKDDQEWRERLSVGRSDEPSKPLDPKWGFDVQMNVGRVEQHFSKWGFPLSMFEFHVGWFQDTVHDIKKPQSIALLRLDADLYESTLVCLQYLYPLLSPGGVCIIDDYAVYGCRQACDCYFNGSQFEMHNCDSDGGPVWWVKA